MPRALILVPQRRSVVSSMPTTTGPSGTKVATSTRSRRWATARADQRAALRTRWWTAKPADRSRPVTRRAAVTVRRPRRQQGAGDQDRHVAPDRGGEAGRER